MFLICCIEDRSWGNKIGSLHLSMKCLNMNCSFSQHLLGPFHIPVPCLAPNWSQAQLQAASAGITWDTPRSTWMTGPFSVGTAQEKDSRLPKGMEQIEQSLPSAQSRSRRWLWQVTQTHEQRSLSEKETVLWWKQVKQAASGSGEQTGGSLPGYLSISASSELLR